MAKRTSDASSITGAVKAMQAALAGVFQPPPEAKLSEDDLVYWNAIIRARARDEWDENQLQVAAQLARTRRQLQEQEELLESEGMVVVNDRGTQICNPRVSVVEQLTRRQMALMRSLQVNATASSGQAIHNKTKRKTERDSRQQISDDLI